MSGPPACANWLLQWRAGNHTGISAPACRILCRPWGRKKNNHMKNAKLILPFLLAALFAVAQTNDELYQQGLKYKAEHKNKEGYDTFCKLMKADSGNINYITNGSYFYCKYGNVTTGTDKDKMTYYKTAEYLAKKAIKMDEKNAEAHYVYCLALGRINEN